MLGRSHDEAMIENFRADPVFAAGLLNSVLEDGDADELRDFLRMMGSAFGIKPVSSESASDIRNLIATIRAMGFRLSVVVPESPKPRRRAGTAKRSSSKNSVVAARRSAAKVRVLS